MRRFLLLLILPLSQTKVASVIRHSPHDSPLRLAVFAHWNSPFGRRIFPQLETHGHDSCGQILNDRGPM